MMRAANVGSCSLVRDAEKRAVVQDQLYFYLDLYQQLLAHILDSGIVPIYVTKLRIHRAIFHS